jgi:hypothetical protein
MKRKLLNKTHMPLLTAALAALAFSTSAHAADKFSDGAITWDTSSSVWSLTTGGTYDQMWVGLDNAIFEGSGDTVALGEAISITNLTINSDDYEIDGFTLNFAGGGVITNTGDDVIISSGITGSPSVVANQGGSSDRLFFAPTSASMAIGTVDRPVENYVHFAGTTAGNTIDAIPKDEKNVKLFFEGSGTWGAGQKNQIS